jgi:hypothetical protein
LYEADHRYFVSFPARAPRDNDRGGAENKEAKQEMGFYRDEV